MVLQLLIYVIDYFIECALNILTKSLGKSVNENILSSISNIYLMELVYILKECLKIKHMIFILIYYN